jgi:hypothetical protein
VNRIVIPRHDAFLSDFTGSITIMYLPNCGMVFNLILPENTVVTDGKGPVVDLRFRPGAPRHLTFGITRITENQRLEVSVCSPDGDNWDSRPLAKFPPKFYCGVYSIPLDPSARPDVRYLCVQWKISRWPKGDVPICDFYVCVEEPESQMRAAVA